MLELSACEFSALGGHKIHVPDVSISGPCLVDVCGDNGCGKSSFFYLLSGFHPEEKAVSNNIKFHGQVATAYAQNRRPVVLMWQDRRLFEHLNPLENILFPYPKTKQDTQMIIKDLLFLEQSWDVLSKRNQLPLPSTEATAIVAL